MSKSLRGPGIILALLYVCFAVCLIFSAMHLPDRVATHFDGAGRPNGWMSRSSHVLFMSGFGLIFPLLPVALLFFVRFLPAHVINLPRRDHWLSAERRGATFAYLLRHSLWFACLAVLLLLGMQFLIMQANRPPEAHLSPPMILGLGAAFVAGTILWCAVLILHFRRVD
jgi:serine/threonine-protein kinase